MLHRTQILFISIVISLTGCMNLAPEYETPAVELSEQWIEQSLENNQKPTDTTNIGWRNYFQDEQLQLLIETALENNHDLKQAALTIEITQQQYNIKQADQFPALGSNASATRSQSQGRTGNRYQVGLGLNNFELDFFGRIKNQSEEALNKYLQTQEARDSAQLSIINAVAKTYFQWRVSEELKNVAKKTIDSRAKSLKLVKFRFQEGLVAGTDVATSQALLANAKVSYQQYVRSTEQAKNALATLVGKPLEQLSLPAEQSLSQQFRKNALFIDTPSEVLLNRPDIRQTEYGLKAANANIGAARALMYPSISLTGNLGYASFELNNVLKDSNQLWSLGPSISLPIFDAGKRKSTIRIRELQKKIAIEKYQKTVRTAFQEIADALVAKKTLNNQYKSQVQGHKALTNTLNMVKLQVQEGLANGLNLLDVERSQFSSQQGLLSTNLQILLNHVDLYTATGGGLVEDSVIEP